MVNFFQVFLKVTDMAGQEETDSLADSQRENGEYEAANDEFPEGHVTNGTLMNMEGHDIEMMDVAGHDEAGSSDEDPLLELDHRRVGQTNAGKFQF